MDGEAEANGYPPLRRLPERGALLKQPGAGTREREFATLLRTNALFRDLKHSITDELATFCSTIHLETGNVLFQKGDPGDALYGVRRGQIRIETGTADGHRVTLNALGAGDTFGEIALLDGRERTADAVATETTELFTLRRDHVLAYISRDSSIAITFIELLCKRLRYVSAQMEESLTLSIGVRLGRRLIALAEDFGDEIHITQDQLAAYLGAARESVNRQLRDWQRIGLLDLKRGRIILRRPEALSAVVRDQSDR